MKNTYNPYKLFVGAFVPNWLLCRREISQGAKLCFAKLAQYAGKSGESYPLLETVAKDLGVSRRQVCTYIKQLEKHKLIISKQNGLGKSNAYEFIKHKWFTSGSEEYCTSRVKNTALQEVKNTALHTYNEENHLRESNKENNPDVKCAKSIKEIFDYWRRELDHKKAKLDKKRANLIRRALKAGYTTDELKNAISGCKKSAWHMGQNENKTVYDDISLILRDSAHVEKFIGFHTGKGKKVAWYEDLEATVARLNEDIRNDELKMRLGMK
ncbi:helix-turn-helix domain-containing protein [Candidatus Woesearchaeota archaeon]|nr:helix-turn-helix domain-containing protein [Candidatus Woesearchaeota archaeon]